MVAEAPETLSGGKETGGLPGVNVEEIPKGIPITSRWWFAPLITLLIAVAISVLTGWVWSARSVVAGWILAAVGGVFIWFAVKVYYTHILVVKREEGEPTVTIDVFNVPIDMMDQVTFEGATGYARDGKGRSLLVVKDFDTETLTASSSWESGLTYLDFFARFELIDEVLDQLRINVMLYGEARYRAVADLLQDYHIIARQGDEILKLSKGLSVFERTKKDDDGRS